MDEALRRKLEAVLTPEELACLDGAVPTRPRRRGRRSGGRNAGRRGEGSIFRDERSGIFYVALYVNGRQQSWSSGSRDINVAKRFLQQKRELVAHNRPATDVRLCELLVCGLTDYRIKNLDTTRDAEARCRIHIAPFFGMRNDEEEFKNGRLAEGATDEQVAAEISERRRTGLTSFAGGPKAKDIGNADAQRYIESCRSAGASDSTIRNELAFLVKVLNMGFSDGRLERKPKLVLPPEPDGKEEFLTPFEYKALLPNLPSELRPMASLAFYTGMRLSECRDLTWDRVDFQRNQVTLRDVDTKSGKGRLVPLYGEPLEMLKLNRQVIDALLPAFPFVFFRRPRRCEKKGGAPLLHIGDVRSRFIKALCATTGEDGKPLGAVIPCPKNKSGVKYVGKTFHAMRHSACVAMVDAGVPRHEVMEIMGHDTEAMHELYNRRGGKNVHLHEAARRVSEFVQAAARTSSAQPQQMSKTVQ
jgi:integrase